MGKATIISEIGAGRYTIQPEWNTAIATARIAALTAENTVIDTRLGTIDAEIAAAEFDYNYATDVLSAAITNQVPEAEIETKQRDTLTKESAWQSLKQTKSFLQLRKVANTKQIEFIQQMTATPAQVQAWCADYTEGATGVVGTIELGRRDTTPIIKPGGKDGTAAAYTTLTDGQLVPLMSGSPAATFYNYALLPGSAKWKARYRTGVASNVDPTTDTMDVSLDALTIAGIACNQAATLTAVPVEYMTCNAQAFTNGDHVLVKFEMNWVTPKVVGFVTDPQPCAIEELFAKTYGATTGSGTPHRYYHVRPTGSTGELGSGQNYHFFYGDAAFSVNSGEVFDVVADSGGNPMVVIAPLDKATGLGAKTWENPLAGTESFEYYYGIAANTEKIYLMTRKTTFNPVVRYTRIRIYHRDTKTLETTVGPIPTGLPLMIAANESGCISLYSSGGATNDIHPEIIRIVDNRGTVILHTEYASPVNTAVAASKDAFWVTKNNGALYQYDLNGTQQAIHQLSLPDQGAPTVDRHFAVGENWLFRVSGNRDSGNFASYKRTDGGFVFHSNHSITLSSGWFWGGLTYDHTPPVGVQP